MLCSIARRCAQFLQFALFVSSVRATLDNTSQLYSNCSLLALEAARDGRYDAPVYAIWKWRVDDDVVTSIVSAPSNHSFILLKHVCAKNVSNRRFPIAFLLYSENLADFMSLLSRLRKAYWTWLPATALIVCLRDADDATLKIVARSLYSINVYNFVILKRNDHHAAIDVYKWHPFAKASRCGAVLDVRRVNVCDGSAMLSPTVDLFSMKMPATFPRGCVINAAAFHWPPYTYASPPQTNNFSDGLNVRMMEALTRMHGVRVNYTLVDDVGRWGQLLKNGTWTGILGVLQRAEVDVALGQILQTPPRFRYFDCSYTCPLFMKFYLARPDKLPHWKSMIRIFSFTFWQTISAIYVVTSVFMCLVSRLTERSENEFHNSCGKCFLNLWRVTLSTPAMEPTSKTARIVFLSWLVYSFHITLIYSSALLGVITTPMVEEPSIRTLEEFSSSDLRLLVVPQFVQISTLMDEGIRRLIHEKYGELKITDAEEIEQMIQRKDFAIVDPHDHFEIVAREKLEYIYSLDDVVRLNQGIYLTKGNIFLKYVDDVQRLVMENGLFEHWRRDLVGADKYRKHRRIEYRNEVLPLTVDELSGSFYLLLFGLSLSGVCFCLELGYEYVLQKKRA